MKTTVVAIICFVLLGATAALAEVELQEHNWDLGTEISHIKYEEPDIMEEEGAMYGVVGSYTYHNKLMLRGEVKGSWGEVDYTSVDSGDINNIDDYMVEARALGGYDFPVSETTILTPYIGFGYRYLNDDMSGTVSTTGNLGYERESNYYYSPIGIETITELDNDWFLGLTCEYDYFWQGKQKSHLSDARYYHPAWGYYTLNDVENDQEKGYGVRGSVKLLKKAEKVDLIIEPYIKYWNIKKSNEVVSSTISENGLWIITSTGYEPKNNSTEIGGKIAIRF
ncbi:MAG: outer membrane beta-barrel protein [Candidatus Omnitrophota bacterium]|nr:MAG: outer membrane beta-barrel protein [Candidatus Omnitrophota bacterium]